MRFDGHFPTAQSMHSLGDKAAVSKEASPLGAAGEAKTEHRAVHLLQYLPSCGPAVVETSHVGRELGLESAS